MLHRFRQKVGFFIIGLGAYCEQGARNVMNAGRLVLPRKQAAAEPTHPAFSTNAQVDAAPTNGGLNHAEGEQEGGRALRRFACPDCHHHWQRLVSVLEQDGVNKCPDCSAPAPIIAPPSSPWHPEHEVHKRWAA